MSKRKGNRKPTRNPTNRELKVAQREITEGRNQVAVMASKTYSGPLPSPEAFEKYDLVLPGAAERILSMAERQATHRQSLETKVVHGRVIDSRLGVIFGFLITIATEIGGIYVIRMGHVVSGSLLSGFGIATLAAVFIYGTRNIRLERQNNSE